jgi:hypothetical protein
VGFEFRKTGALAGHGAPTVDGATLASLGMTGMWPMLPNASGVHCGRDIPLVQ